jgi:hypothetical protein
LRALDEVEGATQLKTAYYRRIVVSCRTDDGRDIEAWVYEFGDLSRLQDKPVVLPDANGESSWRGGTDLEDIE